MNLKDRTLPAVAPNLMMFMIHALLFVVYLHQGNSLFPRAPGEVVPSYLKLIEGSNLTLNCTLKSYSITPLNSSALYFIAVYMNNPQVVDDTFCHILTPQTLQLVIPNVKREDGNVFKCYMNDSDLTNKGDTWIGSATVDIGRPPNPFVNISVVSDNFDNMTVSWCPTVPQADPVDYNMSWFIENSFYSGNCSVWKSFSHCACIFCGTSMSLPCSEAKNQSFHKFQTYNITITSSNFYGSTTTSLRVYTDEAIVKPSPVEELVVTPDSSRSLQASWTDPSNLGILIDLMYQINIFSEWGLNSTIDAGPNTSWLITDLTPSTVYTVAVRCKPTEGGYWSDNSVTSAETMEDVPAVAPESPIGFFRTSACPKENNCQVTIFWKLITASLQNGVILGYRLTVESTLCTSSCTIDIIGGDITSADISLPNDVSSWVRLVAYTSVGESPPHYIFFPSHCKSLPSIDVQGLYAEYTDDGKSGIFFSWNYFEDVDNYTLMYCAGKETDKTHCLSSPINATLPRHQTNFTLSPINVDHVYALSSNYRNGTSGLTPEWICVYDYSGLPAMPVLKTITQVTDTSVKVAWFPLTCTTTNRVRVLNYTLSYINNSTFDGANVTLPGGVIEYTITDLTPEVGYTLTLRGVARSGPGQAATDSIMTNPAKPVNIVTPVAVAVSLSVVVIVVIIIIIYACRRSHKWFNGVTITTPEKYENKNTVNEIVCINNNYAALSDSGNNLHTYSDITLMTSASVMLDYESPEPSCQNSGQVAVMIPNDCAYLEEELLVRSSSQNDAHPTATEHSESVDSGSSNKTTSTSCESDQSIQTYTAVANPGTSPESPSFHCLGSHLPDPDNISLKLQPSIEEPTQDSSDSYGYSQAHHCNNLGSSVDSCSSCDDYKVGNFKEGYFDEPVGDPIAPQLA